MMTPEDEDALRRLLDRDAIRAVLARYCRGADRCDEQLISSCYHEDSTDRHGEFEGTGREFASLVAKEQSKTVAMTQHAISNIVIELAGDVAWVESAFIAAHVRLALEDDQGPGATETFWGRYLDVFERRDGAWAIVTREVIHDWSERRPIGLPMPSSKLYPAGRRDIRDASYTGKVSQSAGGAR
jgi:hypothetical protein